MYLRVVGQGRKNRNIFELIFFGTRGYTSPLSAMSEGQSYLRFAHFMGLLPPAGAFMRATTEDAALDLFQNELFSITRFRELTGAYPTRITIVGHNSKRRRFDDSSPDTLCIGPSSTLPMRASCSGLRRSSARWHQARSAHDGSLHDPGSTSGSAC